MISPMRSLVALSRFSAHANLCSAQIFLLSLNDAVDAVWNAVTENGTDQNNLQTPLAHHDVD